MQIDPIKFIQKNVDSLHALLDLIPLPVYIKDVNGKYLTCNKAFEKTTGLLLAEIVGKNVYEVWSNEQAVIFDAQDNMLYKNPDVQDIELEVNTPSGKKHVVQFHKKIFYDANRVAAGYLCIFTDITEKKSLEKILHSQAFTDELTQLPNRREGLARLAQALHESAVKNSTLCVALLDIDHFKKVNDTYGHAAGDEVLISISNILKSRLWGADICSRYGGEEFLICLPNTKITEAINVLERLRLACESAEIVTSDNRSLELTVSIGLAEFPAQGTTVKALLKASDLALYRAKKTGRNRVVYLDKRA